MFGTLFLSKNQKLVKKWRKEHEEIVILAYKVIAEYAKNNIDATKQALSDLTKITINHVMIEDIEFFKLSKEKDLDGRTKELTHDFVNSFKTTKLALMDFLIKYSHSETPLDEHFFSTFNELVDVLRERINYEDNNLYDLLAKN